jgi:TPR repeat protein
MSRRLSSGTPRQRNRAMLSRSPLLVCYFSSQLGAGKSQVLLAGLMYELGQGVAKDDAKAVHWYTAAAAQGNAEAQYHLGMSILATERGNKSSD